MEYKSEFKDENNALDEEKKNEENENDIYEYILDNLFINTQLLNHPDLEKQIEGLTWFESTFHDFHYVLPPKTILKIFNFITSPTNEILVKKSQKVILWSVSFQSTMLDSLLANGLIDFIMHLFPDPFAWNLAYMIVSQSPKSRQIMIKNGYLEILRSMKSPEELYSLCNQLRSLVNLPFDDIDEPLFSAIFGIFGIIWSHLGDENRQNRFLIAQSTSMLLKSNSNFLYAFMSMGVFHEFLHIRPNPDEIDDAFFAKVFEMFKFVINQNEDFAKELVDHGVMKLAEDIVTNTLYFFENASISAVRFLTDLIFYIPDVSKIAYDKEIVHAVIDMIDDRNIYVDYLADNLSFIVVTMALTSHEIFCKMKNIGCYTAVVDNILNIDEMYWGWTIRIIFRGFVLGRDLENEENRAFLSERNDLINWLEDIINGRNLDLKNKASLLMLKIFPDYVVK